VRASHVVSGAPDHIAKFCSWVLCERSGLASRNAGAASCGPRPSVFGGHTCATCLLDYLQAGVVKYYERCMTVCTTATTAASTTWSPPALPHPPIPAPVRHFRSPPPSPRGPCSPTPPPASPPTSYTSLVLCFFRCAHLRHDGGGVGVRPPCPPPRLALRRRRRRQAPMPAVTLAAAPSRRAILLPSSCYPRILLPSTRPPPLLLTLSIPSSHCFLRSSGAWDTTRFLTAQPAPPLPPPLRATPFAPESPPSRA